MRGNILEYAVTQLFFLLFDVAAEADGRLTLSLVDDLFEIVERTAADEEDVFGVDLKEFLVRMLASALRRNVCRGALEDLQESLLYAFA